MVRGKIPIELGDSWLTAKTMAVVLSLNDSPYGVQHRFHPGLGKFIAKTVNDIVIGPRDNNKSGH